MNLMYKEDLDELFSKGCDCENCKEMAAFINPKCHPSEWLQAVYRQGILYLLCSLCDREVAAIPVAKKILMRNEEAARFLGIDRATLRRWAKEGRIPFTVVSPRGDRLFLQSDLENYLQSLNPKHNQN
jgi:excisionase family DNA binding protein